MELDRISEETVLIARRHFKEVDILCFGKSFGDIVNDPKITETIITLFKENNYFKGDKNFQNLANYLFNVDYRDKRFIVRDSIDAFTKHGCDSRLRKRITSNDIEKFIEGHNEIVETVFAPFQGKHPPFKLDKLDSGELIINFTDTIYAKYGICRKNDSIALLLEIGDLFGNQKNVPLLFSRESSHYAIRIFLDEILKEEMSYKQALGKL